MSKLSELNKCLRFVSEMKITSLNNMSLNSLKAVILRWVRLGSFSQCLGHQVNKLQHQAEDYGINCLMPLLVNLPITTTSFEIKASWQPMCADSSIKANAITRTLSKPTESFRCVFVKFWGRVQNDTLLFCWHIEEVALKINQTGTMHNN